MKFVEIPKIGAQTWSRSAMIPGEGFPKFALFQVGDDPKMMPGGCTFHEIPKYIKISEDAEKMKS